MWGARPPRVKRGPFMWGDVVRIIGRAVLGSGAGMGVVRRVVLGRGT